MSDVPVACATAMTAPLESRSSLTFHDNRNYRKRKEKRSIPPKFDGGFVASAEKNQI
jgi:hypothetical protein